MKATNRSTVLFAALVAALSVSSVSASTVKCFPENNFSFLDDITAPSNVDEKAFNDISDRVVDFFKVFADLKGAKLTVNKNWQDSTVNAYADQDEAGKEWTISMFGGLARRSEITLDGFALVVCHEVGHHFGGFAYYADMAWAAAEGQADYFATEACARALWASEIDENAKFRTTVDATAKAGCDRVWTDQKDRDLCYRTAQGGLSLASLLASLGGRPAPKFNTPDPSHVAKTVDFHPQAQCRLDTYFSGALCNAKADFRVIAGRKHADGQDSPAAERESVPYTCSKSTGATDGLRPACWFKSQL